LPLAPAGLDGDDYVADLPTALDIAVGLDDVLEAGDVDAQVQRAWIGAQELRLLYREPDRVHAERRLLRWLTDIADHEIPELLRLARTLDSWRDENARLRRHQRRLPTGPPKR
jgi:Transposase